MKIKKNLKKPVKNLDSYLNHNSFPRNYYKINFPDFLQFSQKTAKSKFKTEQISRFIENLKKSSSCIFQNFSPIFSIFLILSQVEWSVDKGNVFPPLFTQMKIYFVIIFVFQFNFSILLFFLVNF